MSIITQHKRYHDEDIIIADIPFRLNFTETRALFTMVEDATTGTCAFLDSSNHVKFEKYYPTPKRTLPKVGRVRSSDLNALNTIISKTSVPPDEQVDPNSVGNTVGMSTPSHRAFYAWMDAVLEEARKGGLLVKAEDAEEKGKGEQV